LRKESPGIAETTIRENMHTLETSDGTRFHYSSDFSGDVIVEGNGMESRVPGDALLEFVARAYVAAARISLLEKMGADSDDAVAKLRTADVQALLLNTI
jgi:hypothetical protein